MRVAVYARVSTKDKEQNPETQLRQLREHTAGLDAVHLVGEFVDKASADDLRGRPRWRELLELARRRQVDLIVVWRIDRAFRSVLDGAATLGSLRAWGCGLRSLREPWIDTTTPIGEAMFHITIAWAGLEKRTLSERTRAGMERAREEGKLLGRPRRRPLDEDPRFPKVRDLVQAGVLTRAEGARRLRVRYATFAAALNHSTDHRLAYHDHDSVPADLVRHPHLPASNIRGDLHQPDAADQEGRRSSTNAAHSSGIAAEQRETVQAMLGSAAPSCPTWPAGPTLPGQIGKQATACRAAIIDVAVSGGRRASPPRQAGCSVSDRPSPKSYNEHLSATHWSRP